WRLAFHLLFRPIRDLPRCRRIDAWHRVAHATLMQDDGRRRSRFIPHERDLRVDDVGKELSWALCVEWNVGLYGQMREQMIRFARHCEDGVVTELIESGVAVENGCVHGNF